MAEQNVTDLKPCKFEVVVEGAGSDKKAMVANEPKHSTCTSSYRIILPKSEPDLQEQDYNVRGPMVAFDEEDPATVGRVHIRVGTPQASNYGSSNRNVFVGFHAAKAPEGKAVAPVEGWLQGNPSSVCRVESVTLFTVQRYGELQPLPAASAQDTYQYVWEFTAESYQRDGEFTSGSNVCTGLEVQVKLSNSAPQHFFSFPMKDITLRRTLLENADRTGDLNLSCKDGLRVPAHASVLVSIPYFEAKLRPGTDWNLNKKLDLKLPWLVDREVLRAFLKYAYGDVRSVHQLEPSDALLMQDLFSLSEACGLSGICSVIEDMVVVKPESASSWLELLSREHATDIGKIRQKVKEVVKGKYN